MTEPVRDTGLLWDDVVEDVVKRVGGQQATADDVLNVIRSMRLLSEEWMQQGFPTWRIERHTVAVTGTAQPLTLPKDLDDIVSVNSIVSGSESEAHMTRIGLDQYEAITRKGVPGRPSQWYLERSITPKLYIFPVGQSVGTDTLVVTYISRPDRFETFEPTSDVPGRWLNALIAGLAYDLAQKRPRDDGTYDEALIERLRRNYEEPGGKLDMAKRADRLRHSYRVRAYTGAR